MSPISQRSMHSWARHRARCAPVLRAFSVSNASTAACCRGKWPRLLQFQFHELDARRADVAHRAFPARLLPIKVARPKQHAAFALAGSALHDLAALDDYAQSGGLLCDYAGRLSGFEHQAPGANAFVVEHLRVAGDLAWARRETAGLRVRQRDHDIVEGGRTDVADPVGQRLLGVSGVAHVAARIAPWRRRLFAEHLRGLIGFLDQNADLVARMNVIPGRSL